MATVSDDVKKAQAKRVERLQSAATDLAARLAERQNQPTPTPLQIFLEGDEYETESGFFAYGPTRTLAGEMAVEVLQDNLEAWCNVSLSLAEQLLGRAYEFYDEHQYVFLEGIDYAIEILGKVLTREGLAKLWNVAAHKGVSAAWEKRWEYTKDKSEVENAILHMETAADAAENDAASEYRAMAICLRFKIDNSAIPCILDIPLSHLRIQAVSYCKVAPRKFRFIDAKSFADGHGLRILEFSALPKKRYCTLSYVWRGSSNEGEQQLMQSSERGTLHIAGATNADPISIAVLATVCKCVLARKCELLWIDGICIIQNDEDDKSWQIQNMFNIYKHCMQCIILPGGLSRLVPLTEPTPWIHRA
jgi:hypothetical protein